MKSKEVIENLLHNMIKSEYCRVQDENFSDMNEDDLKELEENLSRINSLTRRIMEMLPKDGRELFLDLEALSGTNSLLESMYMFKRGVIAGLTDLEYLKEADQCISLPRVKI